MDVGIDDDYSLKVLQPLKLCADCIGLVSGIRAQQREGEPNKSARCIYQAYTLIASSKTCMVCFFILCDSVPGLIPGFQGREHLADYEVSATISLEGEIAVVEFEGSLNKQSRRNAGFGITMCIPTPGRYRSK